LLLLVGVCLCLLLFELSHLLTFNLSCWFEALSFVQVALSLSCWLEGYYYKCSLPFSPSCSLVHRSSFDSVERSKLEFGVSFLLVFIFVFVVILTPFIVSPMTDRSHSLQLQNSHFLKSIQIPLCM